MPWVRASDGRAPGPEPKIARPLVITVELDHPLGDVERVVVGQADDAGAEHDACASAGRRRRGTSPARRSSPSPTSGARRTRTRRSRAGRGGRPGRCRAGTSASATRRRGGAARGTPRSGSWSWADVRRRSSDERTDGREPAVETTGLEPATPALQRRCATSCATSPGHDTYRRLLRRSRVARAQSSLRATAFGVTFIFGSYSATSTTRPSLRTPPAGRRGTSRTDRRSARRRRGRSGGRSGARTADRSQSGTVRGAGPRTRSARTRTPGRRAATPRCPATPGPSTGSPGASAARPARISRRP